MSHIKAAELLKQTMPKFKNLAFRGYVTMNNFDEHIRTVNFL